MVNDNKIKELFFDVTGRLKPTWEKMVGESSEIQNYLLSRYDDFIEKNNYREILKRIYLRVDRLAVCKFCGKLFIPKNDSEFCRKLCELNYLRSQGIKQKIQRRKSKEELDEIFRKRSLKLKEKRENDTEWWDSVVKKRKDTSAKKEKENPGYIKKSHQKAIATARKNNSYAKGIEKRKKTIKEKYGDEFYHENAVNAINKFHEKNGYYYIQTDEFKKKAKITKIERYNDAHFNNREKSKNTCQEKYGGSAPASDVHVREKMQQTCLEKYGEDNISRTEYFKNVRYKRYFYDNHFFDSADELVFYKYHVDNGFVIECEPCKLFYYLNGKKHAYFPDFRVDGRLVEIKGEHFFKDGKMINPFDRNQDDLYEAKHRCMLDNGVEIITDCSEYRKYCGKEFIESCLVKDRSFKNKEKELKQ